MAMARPTYADLLVAEAYGDRLGIRLGIPHKVSEPERIAPDTWRQTFWLNLWGLFLTPVLVPTYLLWSALKGEK